LPDGFDVSTDKVVVKGAYNLLWAKKNGGEMACVEYDFRNKE